MLFSKKRSFYRFFKTFFKNIVKQRFLKTFSNIKKNVLLVEFNFMQSSHIAYSYMAKILTEMHDAKLIGYNPSTSLKDGLISTWEWYKKNKKEFELKKNYFKN